MAHLSVVQAVETRLHAGFTGCPVFAENAFSEVPADASAWGLIDFPWSRSQWISAEEFMEEGAFRVLLAMPSGVGAHQGRAWLDEIATLFRGAAFAGVQCYAPQSASTDDQSDRGVTYRLAVTVPYEFIITE